MANIFCWRNLRQGRCLVLLFGYALGIVLGCAITLTFDFRHVEPASAVNVKRELIPLSNDEVIDSTHSPPPHHRLRAEAPHVPASHGVHSISEQHLKNLLYVAVLPTDDIKLSIDSISHTWGQTVSKLAIFLPKDTQVDSGSDNTQILKVLEPSGDALGPPMWPSVLNVIEYIYDNHRSQYKWFLLSSERVYVNIYALHEISDNAGPRDIVYTGHMSLEAGEIPSHYCKSDAGVLLSQEGLVKLGSKLKDCAKMDSDPSWDSWLGKCINQTLGLSCFKIFSKHFVVDKLRTSRSPDELWKPNSIFSKALSIFPVVSSEHMYTLHYYYSSIELKRSMDRVSYFNSLMSDTCQELPQNILQTDVVQSDCSAVIPDEKEEEPEKANSEIKQRVPLRRFKPANKFQYQHWRYFDPFYLYTDDTLEPYVSVKAFKYYSLELKRAIQEAVHVVNKRHHPVRVKFKRLHNGYVRHDPLQGNEYIIDATFMERRRGRRMFNERVRILRPLASNFILQSSKNDKDEKVHIVVPISDVTHRCFEFLGMFANVSLATKEATHLVLVVFGDKDLIEIEEKVDMYKKTYAEAEISIVKGVGTFSRAKALDQGMKSLESGDLTFFCDVDMTIERPFLDRCRRNTVEGRMVYYPEVFKLYNPKFVPVNNRKISRKQGHWVNYGYGMLCIYKSDYDAIGGLNTEMLGWGGEDVDFFEKVLKSKLEVLQSPDTGLIHRWHPNVCAQDTTNKYNRESCIKSRAEALGDKTELARYIYDIMEKHPELT